MAFVFTATVLNNNLNIFSNNSITGVNTSFLYVFDNNVFKKISSYSFSNGTNPQINIVLTNPVSVGGNVAVQMYYGAITTIIGIANTTTVSAVNSTVYLDANAPSLTEMIEQVNYNVPSYVYSNFITGITTQANFPTASMILKRNAPSGAITINEGFLGPMNVHRFAALSSPIFSIASGPTFNTLSHFAFNYNVFGDQVINSIAFSIGPVNTFLSNSTAYLTINEDYFNTPSSVVVGISTVANLSFQSQNIVSFGFIGTTLLSQGKYWVIFTPSSNASFLSGNQIQLQSAINPNFYTSEFLQSSDGVIFNSTLNNGVSFTVNTQRGIVLPSQDAIYNQLNQPQNIPVQYGDASNLSVYTQLAIATSSHYIQKSLIDTAPVYSIDALINSSGQNQYQVTGISTAQEFFYSMIANDLTTNIINYAFYTPQNITTLQLSSLGDYYAQGPQGDVMVSASDFLGVAKIEVSNSATFPSNGTLTILPPNSPQQYITNVPYNFGNLGSLFTTLQNQTGYSIKYIYSTVISGVLNYLLVSDTNLYLYNNSTSALTNVYTLTSSIFTSSTLGTNGVILSDTLGNIYNFANGFINIIGNVAPVPTALSTYLTSTYIGVSTFMDANQIQNRKRIYQLNNGAINHQVWSTNIPEPEITFIYPTSFGLIIGSYNESDPPPYGELYLYYNSLQQLTGFPIGLRPDVAFYSGQSNNLYVGFSGSVIYYAMYENGILSDFNPTGIYVVGNIIHQMSSTKEPGTIIVITDQNSYVFDEDTFVTTPIAMPGYSSSDQQGLFVEVQALDLGLENYESSYINESFSTVFFDPLLNGYTSTFLYTAQGQIVFNGIAIQGFSTSFYIQYPSNSTIQSVMFNGQPQLLNNNSFTQTFSNAMPVNFSLQIFGENAFGVGTIALYNGINSTYPLLGISSLIAPKNLNWYLLTGANNDVFGYSDGSLRTANIAQVSSNQYTVYARFTDITGVVTLSSNYASDVIFNQLEQQINNQALPSGRILQINPSLQFNNITQYVPPEGTNNFIYSGTKLVNATGTFTSDPYFASDVTTWNQIQVLCNLPGYNEISGASTSQQYGTSVTLYVKTAGSLVSLLNQQFVNSYELTTINNGVDYNNQIVSILANISGLTGTWLQFQIVLVTVSAGITPVVISALITYNGAGYSAFLTKTFNTAVQSSIVPTPLIRRGILTGNFVTNGGQVNFYYTTDPTNGNPNDYTLITPNQIFTLPNPSQTIKFGVILLSATAQPAFFDNFGVQLDCGPNDVYFMPAQASFIVQQYVNNLGVAVSHAYQFVNKSVGLTSSYLWNFGTSSIGISTYYPPNEDTIAGPAIYRQNPIIGFAATATQTIGLTVTSWSESINGNTVTFSSDPYTLMFIST